MGCACPWTAALGQARRRSARICALPRTDRLEAHPEQITTWLHENHLQLTRVQQLLGRLGLGLGLLPGLFLFANLALQPAELATVQGDLVM